MERFVNFNKDIMANKKEISKWLKALILIATILGLPSIPFGKEIVSIGGVIASTISDEPITDGK